MGKKSCKKSKSKKGNPTTELPSATHRSGGNDESNTQTNHARTPNALVQAIETCSFHRLLVTYTDTICMASFFSNSNRGKNFAPPDLDVDSITESDDDYQIKRKEVESFIFKVLCEITKSFQKSSRPLQQYRTMCEREIKNMGGVKVIVPTGHGGGDHGASKTFVYTCGFTALKPTKYGPQGREILLQNIHRKIANKSNRIISFLYQRHKDGHPLKDGSTAYDQNSGISFVAQLPNKADVILLKATRMLEATRLYGLEGYNIILLIPVGERLKGKDNVKVNSVGRNEVTALAQGLEVDGHKFLESNGLKFHHEMQKRRSCGWCGVKNSSEVPLMWCNGCRCYGYCSLAHQKLDWKSGHKKICREIQTSREESKISRYQSISKDSDENEVGNKKQGKEKVEIGDHLGDIRIGKYTFLQEIHFSKNFFVRRLNKVRKEEIHV